MENSTPLGFSNKQIGLWILNGTVLTSSIPGSTLEPSLETDPVWASEKTSYFHKTNDDTDDIIDTATNRFVTDTQITNWNTAYGWGDHAGLYWDNDLDQTLLTGDKSGSFDLFTTGKGSFGILPTDPTYYITAGTIQRTTTSGGLQMYLPAIDVALNHVGIYNEVISTVHNSGSTSNIGMQINATIKHTSGTNYQNSGMSLLSSFEPSSGTPACARLYGGTLAAYSRPSGTAVPTTTTALGLLLQAGQYPTAVKGTIGNAQGLQININSGAASGTQKITTAAGVLVNEPVGSGEITSFSGIELSNRYYTFAGTVTGNYYGLYLEQLNGGTVNNTVYSIYLGKQTKGSAQWQLYSEGGNSYYGDGDITFGTTTGTKIGTATTQKLGFWNATPIVQPTTNAYTSDAESSAYTGIDNAQAGSVYAQLADLNTLRVAYDNLRASYDDLLAKLKTTGIVA